MGMKLNIMEGVSLVSTILSLGIGFVPRLLMLFIVFSAPNYVDTSKNQGAFINVDHKYELHHNQFKEVPHPNIKPMAYASSPLMSMM